MLLLAGFVLLPIAVLVIWAMGALIGRLAHPASAKTARNQSIKRTAHIVFIVLPFIDASFIPGESSAIIDFIALFLTFNKSFNKSRNWGKYLIIP
jgi:hypothetical protein